MNSSILNIVWGSWASGTIESHWIRKHMRSLLDLRDLWFQGQHTFSSKYNNNIWSRIWKKVYESYMIKLDYFIIQWLHLFIITTPAPCSPSSGQVDCVLREPCLLPWSTTPCPWNSCSFWLSALVFCLSLSKICPSSIFGESSIAQLDVLWMMVLFYFRKWALVTSC